MRKILTVILVFSALLFAPSVASAQQVGAGCTPIGRGVGVTGYFSDCTAVTGTANAIILTPTLGGTPTTPQLVLFTRFTFQATATNTAATTIRIGAAGPGPYNVYTNAGIATAGGEIVVGNWYTVGFDPTLNSSAGGWRLLGLPGLYDTGGTPVPNLPFGGSWSAHYSASVVDNTSHLGAVIGLSSSIYPVGSGTNGPASADYAGFFTVQKQNYLTSVVEGEIDGAAFITHQGNFGDASGILVDAYKVFSGGGTGGVAAAEFGSHSLTSGGVAQLSMHTLTSFLVGGTGEAFGYLAEARVGTLTSAFIADTFVESGTPTWTNVLVARTLRNDANIYFKIDGTGKIQANPGSGVLPAYSFVGATGDGMWHPGASSLGWATGGVNRVFLDTFKFYPALDNVYSLGDAASRWTAVYTNFTVSTYWAATNAVVPATPGAGATTVFVDSTTKTVRAINDAGILSTTVIADTGSANNFLTAISAGGVISKARPTCANLSDSGSGCSATAGITALTGDVTASGSGSVAATLTTAQPGAHTWAAIQTFTLAPSFAVLPTGAGVASANTVSTLVARDGSGNFAAGTITAALAGNATTATTLATPRAIYGNNFDGSAALTQVIASTFGGTGNGFTKFTGPTTAEKTFTLPNANATILTDNAVVTVAQGGTGVGTFTTNGVLYGNGTSAIQATAQGAANTILAANAGAPSFTATPTIGTSLTVPLVIGGSGTTGTQLTFQTTTGTGTTDRFAFVGGTNGGTSFGTWSSAALALATTQTWTVSSASGPGLSLTQTQTAPNSTDTNDTAFSLVYTITGSSATNELVQRVFNLDWINTLTGGGAVTAARLLNIAGFTAASTTTTSLDNIYIESGTAAGTVTTGYGLHIFSLQGTTKWGIGDESGGNWFNSTGGLSLGNASTPPAGGLLANGHLTMNAATKTLVLKQGANGSVGTFVCTSGGSITVNNSNVALTDTIIISLNTAGGSISTAPALNAITASTSFVAKCATSDTSTYNYAIIKNAA